MLVVFEEVVEKVTPTNIVRKVVEVIDILKRIKKCFKKKIENGIVLNGRLKKVVFCQWNESWIGSSVRIL